MTKEEIRQLAAVELERMMQIANAEDPVGLARTICDGSNAAVYARIADMVVRRRVAEVERLCVHEAKRRAVITEVMSAVEEVRRTFGLGQARTATVN